jgi:hypothetical protein
MTTQDAQEVLDRILTNLRSGDETLQLSAVHELEGTNFSSEAIVLELEKLTLNAGGAVQQSALHALSLKTSQLVASNLSSLPKYDRGVILAEISRWRKAGLLTQEQAEVISRRYDFDIIHGTPIKTPATQSVEKPGAVAQTEPLQPAVPAPASDTVAPPLSAEPKVVPPPKPVSQRPSLTQVLLSETSIRIYLYLGAFFVIASAAILAALVEAARLPILLVATLIFAGGAIGIKKRLPQPSFTLAVVFSFLLPIDASVMADMFNLSVRGNDFYWSGFFLLMVAIWGFGTWLYESRIFSLASLAALILALVRINAATALPIDWTVFTLGAAGLLALVFVRALQNWKDNRFALPVFLSAQVLQVAVLFMSLTYIAINFIGSDVSPGKWVAHALTWLFAASFFAVSNLLIPIIFFPWAAVASLLLLPWLFLSSFDLPASAQITGLVIWGALMAFASEAAQRSKQTEAQKYHLPLLAVSLPLFAVSSGWGLIEGASIGFAALFTTGVVYTLIHYLRPRWYVWTVALLAFLGAYFTFFVLSFMQKADVYFGYQLLIASVLLLLPELFSKESLASARTWKLPSLVLGIVLASLNLYLVHIFLLEEHIYFSRAAFTIGVYALLFAAYARHFKQPLIAYLATALLALTIVYALAHFELDLWLPSLTALGVVYSIAGYLLRRNESLKSWGAMFSNSGLTLGAVISLMAVVTFKPSGGWYALAIAALFAVDMFTRRKSNLEPFIPALVNIALILFLNDLNVQEPVYHLFGSSLIWLGSDAIFNLTYQTRNLQNLTRIAGGLAAIATVTMITTENRLAPASATICFEVYTAFFAAYAWLYQRPVLGYLSTAAAAATLFYALDHFRIEAWLPFFTGLSLLYYLTGFFLQKKSAGWSETFRYSGLALGSMVSLKALIVVEPTGGWYAVIVGVLFALETGRTRNGWFEAGIHLALGVAAFLILRDFQIHEYSYILLALSLVWLGGDAVIHRIFAERQIAAPVQMIGAGLSALNSVFLLTGKPLEAAVCFGSYAVFFAVYALVRGGPSFGYASTVSLPLAVFFGLRAAERTWWIFPVIVIAVLYYSLGFALRQSGKAKWDIVLLFSGLGLGTVTALLAPVQPGGVEKAIPIALGATLFAAEAYHLRNVWLTFPANALYLIAYFTLLIELNVDQPQYFSIGAALLGMLMHYLLVRAQSKTGAFIMGSISQLVLLGTSYIQLVSTSEVGFFFVLFLQSLVILFYGLYMRSRSLVFAPIVIVVFATLTILYSALRNLSLAIIIGVSGIALLTLGILAVLMRERIASFVERLSDWNA